MDFITNQIFTLSLLVILCSLKLEAERVGLIPEGTQCVCIGDRVVYNCGVVGGSSTVWRGSVFDCPLDGSVITLRHTQFESNQAIGICNNGDISGLGLETVNNCYTSQLNVTIRENFNNKSVECVLNSREGTRIIGESVLNVVSAINLYPPPDNIYLAHAQPGALVFNWTSNCSTLKYNIISDCGTCPPITNTTTATCSDLQLTTNVTLCNFRVSSVACDLVGNPSPPFVVMLKVPNVPQVQIIPSYSNHSQVLEKLYLVTTMTQTEELFNISDGISGSPVSYTAHVSTFISSTSFDSTVGLSVCDEGRGCPFEIPSSYCSRSTIITVTISAANKLGSGPHSNPFIIECVNNFVQVVRKESISGSTISCVFLNSSDTSEKTCCIILRPCDQNEFDDDQTEHCSNTPSYDIQIEISGRSNEMYCYTVTATNDTYAIRVEGSIAIAGFDPERNVNTAAIAIGIVIACICITIIIVLIVIITVITTRRRQPDVKTYTQSDIKVESPPVQSGSLKRYLNKISLSDESLEQYEVKRDCQMREFILTTLDFREFRRGHTYYEFVSEKENILKGKDVLLQDKKNTEKWFRLAPPEEVAAGRLKLYGEGIARSSFGDQYRVFIQSFGSGVRYLPCDSSILYNRSEDQVVDPDVLPLVPVCSEYFAHEVINSEKGLSAQQFCTQNELSPTAFSIFLTVEHLPEGIRDQPPRDVILMDKVSWQLFTGPYARQMLDPRNGGEVQLDNEKWKVFALLGKNKQGLVFKKNSEVLYQNRSYMKGKYLVLEVKENDVMRMSKFIATKLDCQYEDGKAFYEAGKEEDFLYCKKILRLENKELSHESVELTSPIEYFYAIGGVPAKGIKPEKLRLEHHKIFIQSTSQGSRCLNKGDKLLYLQEYISDQVDRSK